MIETAPTLLQVTAAANPGLKIHACTGYWHWFAMYDLPFLPDDFVSIRYESSAGLWYTRRPEWLEPMKALFAAEIMEILL